MFKQIVMTAALFFSFNGVALANDMSSSEGAGNDTTISGGSDFGGGNIKIFSGQVRSGQVVPYRSGFTPNQCLISITASPVRADGGYKRSRNCSTYYAKRATGFQVYFLCRHMQNNRLTNQSSTPVQWQMICAS